MDRRCQLRRRTLHLLLAVLLGLVGTSILAAQAAPVTTEAYHYRWRIKGIVGVLAGLFMPRQGDGVLTFRGLPNNRLESELLITSEKSKEGEFWRYGSLIDLDGPQAVEAWSSYRWRGRSNSKHQSVDRGGVLDIVSGIYALRLDPPDRPRPLDIWSDGKIYPVLVIPHGVDRVSVAGDKVRAQHLEVRGVERKDGRRWKGSLELWLADDAARTPVQIRLERSLANLELELQPPP